MTLPSNATALDEQNALVLVDDSLEHVGRDVNGWSLAVSHGVLTELSVYNVGYSLCG